MQRLADSTRSNHVMQIDVLIEDYRVVIPCLPWPEPDPARPSNERANEDQRDPHQKSPAKHPESKAALFERVVTVAQWIRINIRKYHQSDHDDRRHHYAGDPGIEIDQHFLETQEVPWGLRRIHRQIGVGRFFQRGIERDRPNKKNHRDNYSGKKLNAHKIRPDMNLSRPTWSPRFSLAMVRLC